MQISFKQECIPVGCVPSAAVDVCLAGGLSGWGVVYISLPTVDRILDTRLWKHNLSATSFADGKNFKHIFNYTSADKGCSQGATETYLSQTFWTVKITYKAYQNVTPQPVWTVKIT